MRLASSSRTHVAHLGRQAGATIAVLTLLAGSTDSALAGSVQRPIVAGQVVVASQPARVAIVQELIDEAAHRFGVPAPWIAEVMLVESRGRANALSSKGAIGLMQVMPETYAGLALRYGLGSDPWNPRDNVLAGAAYLRELYDRYGAPGFLVAYNAGPSRWEDYWLHARPLPAETVSYLARLSPVVGGNALPLPTDVGAGTAWSPLAGPIFVTSGSEPARVQVAANPAPSARAFGAEASDAGRADAIFVRRSRAMDLPRSKSAIGDETADAASPNRRSADVAAPASPSPSELFPPRMSTASRP